MLGWWKNKRPLLTDYDTNQGKDCEIPFPDTSFGDIDSAESVDDYRGEHEECGLPSSQSCGILGLVAGIMENGKGMVADAAQVTETYRACQEISRDIEAIKAKRDVELARIVAGFKICNSVLDKTFGERADALEKHYQALDKALESGNNELIIEALHGISGIVTTSPLESFQKTVKELMQIKKDDVLELDF